MVSLRRQKLKAKRAGCSPVEVEKCSTNAEVVALMNGEKQTKLNEEEE